MPNGKWEATYTFEGVAGNNRIKIGKLRPPIGLTNSDADWSLYPQDLRLESFYNVELSCVAGRPDRDYLIGASGDHRVYTYDVHHHIYGEYSLLAQLSGNELYGFAIHPTSGNIYFAGFNHNNIVRYNVSTNTWDSGHTTPSGGTGFVDCAFKSNGDLLLISYDNHTIYTYDDSAASWDSGFTTADNASDGVAVKSNGDIITTGRNTRKIYTYSSGSWDSGVAIPSVEHTPCGVTTNSSDDIIFIGRDTNKFYTYDGTNWDDGIPTRGYLPYGIADYNDSTGKVHHTYYNAYKIYLKDFDTGISARPALITSINRDEYTLDFIARGV